MYIANSLSVCLCSFVPSIAALPSPAKEALTYGEIKFPPCDEERRVDSEMQEDLGPLEQSIPGVVAIVRNCANFLH